MNIYRSPDPADRSPASPSPDNLILVPLSTPGGTFTDNFFVLLRTPVPRQDLHGSEII